MKTHNIRPNVRENCDDNDGKKLLRKKYGCQDIVNGTAPEAELKKKNNELIKTVIIVVSVCIGSVCFRGAFEFFSFVRSLFISFYVP